ncbi:TIGR03087 family PEP-CTERM/XrtA system glycosyltransferase [Thiohalorhabdus methylotrophus]|uniref:TIGR03087 family PEP-CTERM/XrtA system glycosyltransferase n=1 Tax=Thiohalorhabdus methylotrophus TaxID=3242694 RepID=A0ABV4TXU3_9GAMM
MSHKEPLLFLAHRIPYPPNKGDKIRSFHLLEYLSRHYEVHLGAFVDDVADWRYADEVGRYCTRIKLVPLDRGLARVRSLRGLVSGDPLSLPFYQDRRMEAWVRSTLRRVRPGRVVVFSSSMAQYVPRELAPGARRVLDMVDVDSAKWTQYGRMQSGPMRWVFRREGQRLREQERKAAADFDTTVLVTRPELQLFAEAAPESRQRLACVGNGVDVEYFAPSPQFRSPYPKDRPVLAFTGAMDYWANVDAVTWFASEVWPLLREQIPEALFYIVGARPTEPVRSLDNQPGIHVTGSVPDIRPYLAHAHGAVAPLRVARGIQNKVLEAMAMARPVVATGAALDGLEALEGYPLQGEEPESLARAAAAVLSGDCPVSGADLRAWVQAHYTWEAHLERFRALLEGEPWPECLAETERDRSMEEAG